jgi:hypothetical protein
LLIYLILEVAELFSEQAGETRSLGIPKYHYGTMTEEVNFIKLLKNVSCIHVMEPWKIGVGVSDLI